MQTQQTVQELVGQNDAVMLYFTAPSCSVCHALKPKLTESLIREFPTFIIESIDISEKAEIASYFGVFMAPTVLIYLQGNEFLRKSRNMSVAEVVEGIRRPYTLMVEN